MKVDKKDIQKWVKALRSGKYKQGTGALQNESGYCCLGVACKVLVPNYTTDNGYLIGTLPQTYRNAPKWLSNIDNNFNHITNKNLVVLNDADDYSFDEIADLLQAVYILEVLK